MYNIMETIYDLWSNSSFHLSSSFFYSKVLSQHRLAFVLWRDGYATTCFKAGRRECLLPKVNVIYALKAARVSLENQLKFLGRREEKIYEGLKGNSKYSIR